ncbi:MAG: hypothetical protein ABIX28_13685 [Vicinamibacterales bacterium]
MPSAGSDPPALSAFTTAERRIIERCRSPHAVQGYLNALPYNNEPRPPGETLRSFRGVVRYGTAHCLEAALAAAVILEQHRLPPLVLSFESIDGLDHVIFVYRWRGRWGSIARSRDPGLHGRRPVFATPRALALSYVDPYVDLSGRVTAYAVVDLRVMGHYDWRLSSTNVWKVERMLLDYPHRPIRTSNARFTALRKKYRAFKKEFPDLKPVDYPRRDRWTELPPEWRDVEREITRRRGNRL